jgi:hypothetical protein
MKQLFAILLSVLLVLLSLCVVSCTEQRVLNPQSELVGKWQGDADFYPVPIRGEIEYFNMEYEFNIEPDGRLTGYVGDADINETYVVRTTKLLRMLGNEEFRSIIKLNGRLNSSKDFYNGKCVLFIGKVVDNKMYGAGMNIYTKRYEKSVRIMSNKFPLANRNASQ